MKHSTWLFLPFVLLFLNCENPSGSNSDNNIDLGNETDFDIPDWTTESHSNDVDPDYEMVFGEQSVKEFFIQIDETNWSVMQSDLSQNMTNGSPGAELDFDPVWVPASIKFEGREWYKVGIRYKGNSTLRNAFNANTDKYPFKLDFDEFEDDFPQIKNQRFFGFKQLNLSNNDSDGSFLREKLAADLFRKFGVPSAQTAFYAVYLDRGNGSEYIGLYTLVEEVDDSVPDSQFGDGKGNLYKPDGDAASFAFGSYDKTEFDLKTNEDEADYSDVRALFDLLHDDLRATNTESWKTALEQIFDVDGFLKYLAVNNVIQNWDTYGIMTHNYFLYNDGGLLTWIPWDNNESFQDGKQGGAVSLSMSEVSSNWPLINYLMQIDSYYQTYKSYVNNFVNGPFSNDEMKQLITAYQEIIEVYAVDENSGFSSETNSLLNYVESRNSLAKSFSD